MLKKLLMIKKMSTISCSFAQKKEFLLLPILAGLSACGGGGSSSSEITPTVPKSYPFSLTSTISNKCGESLPFIDVELFIQNSDWSVVEKLLPNENGVFSFSSESELINYTLVAKTQQ